MVAALWAVGSWGAGAVSSAALYGSVDPAKPQFCVQPARERSFEFIGIRHLGAGGGGPPTDGPGWMSSLVLIYVLEGS